MPNMTDAGSAAAFRRGLSAHREFCALCTPTTNCAQAERFVQLIAETTAPRPTTPSPAERPSLVLVTTLAPIVSAYGYDVCIAQTGGGCEAVEVYPRHNPTTVSTTCDGYPPFRMLITNGDAATPFDDVDTDYQADDPTPYAIGAGVDKHVHIDGHRYPCGVETVDTLDGEYATIADATLAIVAFVVRFVTTHDAR